MCVYIAGAYLTIAFLESQLAVNISFQTSTPHSVILLPAMFLLFACDGFKIDGTYFVLWWSW
jgi:hypothetical protein